MLIWFTIVPQKKSDGAYDIPSALARKAAPLKASGPRDGGYRDYSARAIGRATASRGQREAGNMLKRQEPLIRSILPSLIRRALRDLWEDLRDWVDTFAFGLRFVAAHTQQPKILLYFGYAPGDDLLSTAVMRELRKRGRDGLLMVSDHRELFEGNQDPAYVRPLWARYSRDRSTVSICGRFVRIWGGKFTRTRICASDR